MKYPAIGRSQMSLGGSSRIIPVPIPLHCADDFQEAFYGRPVAFLQKEVRKAQSAWGFLPDGLEGILVQRLAADLQTGARGHYRQEPFFMAPCA